MHVTDGAAAMPHGVLVETQLENAVIAELVFMLVIAALAMPGLVVQVLELNLEQ